MKPSFALVIMELLSTAQRENLGALHVDEIAARVYPDRRPVEYAASIRCAIGRLRKPLAKAGLGVVCHSSSYALRSRTDALPLSRIRQGSSLRPPIKERVRAGMRARRERSAQLEVGQGRLHG